MKHLPGSWKLGKQDGTVIADSKTTERLNTGHDAIEYYGGYLVCESIATQEIAQAITALPDLLEACRHMIALWDANCPDDPCGCLAGAPNDITDPPPCALCFARAAIAKAEETP